VEDEVEDFEDMQDDDDDDDFEPPSNLPTNQTAGQSLGPGRTLGGGPATSTGASTPEPRTSSAAGKAKRTGGYEATSSFPSAKARI